VSISIDPLAGRVLRRLYLVALCAAATVVCRASAALPGSGGPYRDLFKDLLGKNDSEVDSRINSAWKQLFYGSDDTERLYYPVAGDMAYIPDVANNDVRTEGLSYGMMICVQLDRQKEFNEVWKWARTKLYHETGPASGYFGWHGTLDGKQLDPGPAPDGEEWFVASLFFAAHRWGSGSGIFDYEGESQRLLHTMIHKAEEPARGEYTSMFDAKEHQIVFVPEGPGAHFTDPSYHLPFFYELWARWASDPSDRAFCAEAAVTSRSLFKHAANPTTGLMPDYSDFDGAPHERRGHEDFRYDAWRTLCYPALDYSWFNPDPWVVERSDRVLRFLASHGGDCPDLFKLDGTPVSENFNATGLFAMAATAGLAASPDVARPFVAKLWEMPTPTGRYRYYNGLLYMMALLESGGRFKIYGPPATVSFKSLTYIGEDKEPVTPLQSR
jgi:oligosaccharide reducing-end xylanase